MNTWIRYSVWPLILVPGIWLALSWNRLPAEVALHFDFAGRPDRWGSRRELIGVTVLLSVLNAGIYLLLINIYRIDPKQKAAENKERLRKMAFAIVLFMTLIQCLVLYSSQAGSFRMTASLILAATGFLFSVIGNYMPNLRPNYFAGLRLPWTLENEDNWRRTHALMGRLWFAGGLLIALFCLLVPPAWALPLFFSITILMTGIPVVFSYRLFQASKKEKKDSV